MGQGIEVFRWPGYDDEKPWQGSLHVMMNRLNTVSNEYGKKTTIKKDNGI